MSSRLQRTHLVVALLLAASVGGSRAAAQVGPIDFKSREAREGRNYTEAITATLAVGKSSGQTSYTFPFALPPGRGVSPTLSISYISTASYSEVGQGWALDVPVIERSTRYGVAHFDDRDTFQFREGHSAAELIPTGELTSEGWSVYREQSERSFARYLRRDNEWRVLRSDGLRLELGTAPSSRRGPDRDHTDTTSAWLLAHIIDPHGNVAEYAYLDGLGQQALLRTIQYTSNPAAGVAAASRVDLIWEPLFNADEERMISFRRGYRETFGADRLARVEITAPQMATAGSPAGVPASSPSSLRYTLTHGVFVQNTTTFQLQEVQLGNHPPIRFDYAAPWPNQSAFEPEVLYPATGDVPSARLPDELVRSETETEDAPRTWTFITIADATGDGLPDVIDARSRCESDQWVVWRNVGGRLQAEVWPAPDVTDGATLSRCAVRVSRRVPSSSSTFQDFVDFTGDSIPDVVFWQAADMFICRGTGSGFEPCEIWGALPAGVTAGVFRKERTVAENINVTEADLMDFNGDGLVDRVSTSSGSSPPILHVVLNEGGQRWGELLEVDMPSCGFPGVVSCLRLTERILSGDANRRLVAETRDINGDGLPDFLMTDVRSGSIGVAWGTGRGFEPLHLHATAPAALGLGRESSGGDYHALIDLADFDGDGLPDVIEISPANPGVFAVRFNHGGAWDLIAREYHMEAPPLPQHQAPGLGTMRVDAGQWEGEALRTVSLLVDMNGDGIADFVSSRLSTPLAIGDLSLRTMRYQPPRYLTSALSLAGNAVSTVDYAPQPGAAPFPLHAPASLTRQRSPVFGGEPQRLTHHTTNYDYADGTYDRRDREFRGYRTVVATPKDYGVEVTTNYLTGKFTAGLVETEVAANVGGQGAPRTIIHDYTEVTLSIGSVFARRDRTRVFDGPLFEWRLEETRFADHLYGIPRQVTAVGDPSTTADDRVDEIALVVRRDSDHLLVLPAARWRSVNGTTIAHTELYYDDRTQHAAIPTKGNLVRSRVRLLPFVYADASAYYDDEAGPGLGLKVRYVDPEGAQSEYLYDETFRQYAVEERTLVGTVHRSFHSLSGLLADVCGPQFLGSSWRCGRTEVDDLGRVTAQYVPVRTPSGFDLQVLSQTTYDETAHPMRVRTVRRPQSIDAAVVMTYVDGFGNAIQTRTEETPGVFRVTGQAVDALGTIAWTDTAERENGEGYTWGGPAGDEDTLYTYDYLRGSLETAAFPIEPGSSAARPSTSSVHHGTHVERIDEVGRVTSLHLNEFGELVSQVRDGGALGLAVTLYDYDHNGRLGGVMDPEGLETRYLRNDAGWVRSVTLPDGGKYTYLHNRRGQVVRETDPRGVAVDRMYDSAGRIERALSAEAPFGVRAVDEQFFYHTAATSSAELGWTRRQEADNLTETFQYDGGGRITQHRVQHGTSLAEASYTYTFDGRISTITYGDGWKVGYQYSLDDAPHRAYDTSSGRILAEILRDDRGRISVLTNDFGLDESYDYDERDRVVRIVSANVQMSAGPLVDDELAWSPDSKLMTVHRLGLLPGAQPRTSADTWIVHHDELGRLERVIENGDVMADYEYDLAGRLQRFEELGVAEHYAYDADRLRERTAGSSTTTYTYDDAGSVAGVTEVSAGASASRILSWDAAGRLASVWAYDSSGNDDLTDYYYLAGKVVRVTSPGAPQTSDEHLHVGEVVRFDTQHDRYLDRVWLGNRLILERDKDEYRLMHRTLGGSVAAVTSSDGQVLRQEEYLPYGRTRISSGSPLHEAGFHGLRRDEYIVAGPRAYDAAAGRWLARDPMQRVAAEFAGMVEPEGYAYSYDSPFSYRDPSGLQPESTGDYYVEGMELPPGYYVGPNDRIYKADPEGGPVEVQQMQTEADYVQGYVEAGNGAANSMLDFMEMTPLLGSVIAAQRGKYAEAAVFGLLDVLSSGVSRLGRGAKIAIAVRGAGTAASVCFGPGTPVRTDRGDVPIENLKTDDVVACADVATGAWTTCRVETPWSRWYEGTVYTVTLGSERIDVTPDHPFWVVQGEDLATRSGTEHLRGTDRLDWSAGRWVDARALRVGDVLATLDGNRVTVDALTTREDALEVYNLEIASFNTYAVGRLGALVHNRAANVVARVVELSMTIHSRSRKKYECIAYARLLQKRMVADGLKGEKVRVTYRGGLIPHSKRFGVVGTSNDVHDFIVVGDTVFDNMNWTGVPYDKFLDDMNIDDALDAGGIITRTPF